MFKVVGAARCLATSFAVVAAIGVFSFPTGISGPASAEETFTPITIAAAPETAAPAAPAKPQPQPASARVIVTPDSDYPNFDYDTLKGVTLDGCKAACLADQKCRAFTFNQKAGWCFMKSDFGALAGVPGSTAGRVVQTAELTPSVERKRQAELNFFSTAYLDEARAQIGSLKRRFDPGDSSFQALRDAGGVAYRAGNYDEAAEDFGKALMIASENPGLWLDFATASLPRKPETYDARVQAESDVTAAAINAYLRSEQPANRAAALALMGDGFANREIWKPAYKSYRASLAIKPNDTVQASYDKVTGEHGFRIISHDVDADSANPRICIVFSDTIPVTRPDLTDFVTVDNGEGLAIEPSDHSICVNGIKHGSKYHLRVRGGLPAADGESLPHPVELDVLVRDRAPFIGFAGNAYVLPAGKDASIPMVSVNTDKAKAQIYRIGDRALAGEVRDENFLHQLDSYSADTIKDQTGEKIWEGEIGIVSKLNENITTAIPIAQVLPALKPGIYVITAKPAIDQRDEYSALATQWFIVSDLGLTTLSGHDGVHALVRSLATAQPVAGVKVRLIATNNDVLAEAVTDGDGHARFDPGLARGTGGMALQLVDAKTDGGDYAFLDLTRSAFDLSDRGVEGRAAPQPLDVFVTPERGIYRPGETMHLTALVRDPRATAVPALPLTLVVIRPDGVEFLRKTVNDAGLGGYSADVAFDDNAMRGSWSVELFADPKGNPLAQTSVLVEDFEPERLAFELSTEAKALSRNQPTNIDLVAKYLYGATAPGLSVEGDLEVSPVTALATFPGFRFGLADETVQPERNSLELDAETDDDGKASFAVSLPELKSATRLFEATLIIRLADTNGRTVERTLKLPVKSDAMKIGIRPLFNAETGMDENAEARFEVVAVSPDGQRVAEKGLTWKLERLENQYQWYKSDRGWNYELITNTQRIANGTVDTSADGPATLGAKVEWGRYRLTVASEGDQPTASSVEFEAGWYVGNATSETPDVLKVGLDKPAYKIGDTAKLRLDPRFAGTALVTVIDDRLIAMKAVEVPAEGTTVDLPVTEEWGPGAYVTASLYRPMDIAAKRMPARALGLTWAKVAPGDRQLALAVDLPDEMRPRGPMTIPVAIGNLGPDSEAYVTVAAVDVGILNLTNFKPPAPDDWYFGQRKLGMEIRDLYGLLIDRMQGVPGTIKSGGDSGATRLQAPPPTEKLVAFYSGIVRVGPDGKATVTFDIPDFNGTIRVMVMAWSKEGVGHAAKDVIVRDPVVVSASLPRFLLRDDKSRLLVEINNVAGVARDYLLSIKAGDGIGIAPADQTRKVSLKEKERLSINIPISGKTLGDYDLTVSLASPAGDEWPKALAMGIRAPGSPVTRRNLVALNGGGKLSVGAEALAEFIPETTSVAVSVGGAARLDVAGILSALDRYPYGCVEQLTSRAMPLVYLDDVASSIGMGSDKEVHERVQKAIAGILSDQDAAGSFGLWGPYNTGDLWIDSYVTDFLTRAAEKGYEVPKVARDIALQNLQNRVNYSEDFEKGGEDIAYALYVLARTGRAAIGDLRYYAETKLRHFRTPLAKAQIGAALALYGDRQRAGLAFKAALTDLGVYETDDYNIWRGDYGTSLRDKAAVLTLAAETRAEAIDLHQLAVRIANQAERRVYTSTQENAWMMLAAAALIKDAAHTKFAVDGSAVAGPLFKRFAGDRVETTPVVIENLGPDALDAVVASTGVPIAPEPAGGDGFKIERHYYSVAGEEIDIKTVAQNDRVVVVDTVTADTRRTGRILVVDRIPAGYEIENPDVSKSGDVEAFDWLSDVVRNAAHTEARTDRFVAALNRDDSDPLQYSVAFSMRAVSPGVFTQPAATVEDMYRPGQQARTEAGTVEIVGPTK